MSFAPGRTSANVPDANAGLDIAIYVDDGAAANALRVDRVRVEVTRTSQSIST